MTDCTAEDFERRVGNLRRLATGEYDWIADDAIADCDYLLSAYRTLQEKLDLEHRNRMTLLDNYQALEQKHEQISHRLGDMCKENERLNQRVAKEYDRYTQEYGLRQIYKISIKLLEKENDRLHKENEVWHEDCHTLERDRDHWRDKARYLAEYCTCGFHHKDERSYTSWWLDWAEPGEEK